jgi:ABC-type multidrug transport system fused ATPase/permease subunit
MLLNGSDAIVAPILTMLYVSLFSSVEQFISTKQNIEAVYFFAIMCIVVSLAKAIVKGTASVSFNAVVFEKSNFQFKYRLYEVISKVDFIKYEDSSFLDQTKKAEKALTEEILPMIFNYATAFVFQLISVITVTLILARYHLLFIPISLLSVIPYYFIHKKKGAWFYHINSLSTNNRRRMEYFWKLFTNKQYIKEMRVSNSFTFFKKKWTGYRDVVLEEIWKHRIDENKAMLFGHSIRTLGYFASVSLSIYLVLTNQISIAVLAAALSAFTVVQLQVQLMLKNVSYLSTRVEFAKDYYGVCDLLIKNEKKLGDFNFNDSIEVQDMYFSYPNAKELFNGLNLNIKKGQTVAIVGENGCGKTTLTKLLLSVYCPNKGKVSIDNIDINNICKESIYHNVSLVSQFHVNYQLSLRENIALGEISRLDDDQAIKETIDKVGLSYLLDKLKLDDTLGREFGNHDLSGGEWQRLAIGRAIYKESDLIVLDEPTSALDPLIENEILSNFIEISKDKTSIIVSHRVGICTKVDRVIVLKDGQIIADGPHQELMENSKYYHELFSSQQQWYV